MKREYPKHPLVGVGGVVIHRDRVLLIRRGSEPLKGEWSIPGGLVDVGEKLTAAVRRELKEETGLDVEPLEMITAFDRIMRDGRRVKYHFVIVDYVCRLKGGRLRPASDVIAARWVRREDLPQFHLAEMATKVILQSFEFFKKGKGGKGDAGRSPLTTCVVSCPPRLSAGVRPSLQKVKTPDLAPTARPGAGILMGLAFPPCLERGKAPSSAWPLTLSSLARGSHKRARAWRLSLSTLAKVTFY
jgi:ADP-ribose pyrophosphatase YjhB (NUDIX family)